MTCSHFGIEPKKIHLIFRHDGPRQYVHSYSTVLSTCIIVLVKITVLLYQTTKQHLATRQPHKNLYHYVINLRLRRLSKVHSVTYTVVFFSVLFTWPFRFRIKSLWIQVFMIRKQLDYNNNATLGYFEKPQI